jgi:hypothetical protein
MGALSSASRGGDARARLDPDSMQVAVGRASFRVLLPTTIPAGSWQVQLPPIHTLSAGRGALGVVDTRAGLGRYGDGASALVNVVEQNNQ